MTRVALYEAALCAAFWVALAGFARRGSGAPARFVASLALGAALARAGGLLFVPAPVLVLAPRGAAARAAYLAAALPALPLAFGAAKLGCLAAGCCAAAGAEALGFAAAHLAAAAAPRRRAAAVALGGIAAVRLAALPFRPEARASALLAALWLAAAALRCRPSDGGDPCPRPGNATSSRTAPSSKPGCAGSCPTRATSC